MGKVRRGVGEGGWGAGWSWDHSIGFENKPHVTPLCLENLLLIMVVFRSWDPGTSTRFCCKGIEKRKQKRQWTSLFRILCSPIPSTDKTPGEQYFFLAEVFFSHYLWRPIRKTFISYSMSQVRCSIHQVQSITNIALIVKTVKGQWCYSISCCAEHLRNLGNKK